MKASEFFVRKHQPVVGTCFVLMPFEEGMNAVYEHGIKPLVEELGLQCRRADEMYSTQGILDDIWNQIQSAELIISDLTGKNPNVMYELGLCHSLWKRVILLSQNKDDVPFDLRAWRVIWYDFTFQGAARLKDELRRAIEAIRSEEGRESQIVPLTLRPQPRQEKEESEWLRGVIQNWKKEESYGFIRVEDEDFYFNPHYLFTEAMKPEEGRRVVFQPLEPLPPARNRRASGVFIHGTRMNGRLNRVVEAKGYGFADIYGDRGAHHNLFVLVRDEHPCQQGDEIEFDISDNEHGPIGVNVIKSSPEGEEERRLEEEGVSTDNDANPSQ